MELKRKIANMLLALVLCGSGACATTITYGVSGTLEDGAVLSGTMTIDNTAGLATAADFILSAPDSGTFSVIESQNRMGSSWFIETVLTGASPGSFPALDLVFPKGTLVGYGGGSFCSVSFDCASGFISSLGTGF